MAEHEVAYRGAKQKISSGKVRVAAGRVMKRIGRR